MDFMYHMLLVFLAIQLGGFYTGWLLHIVVPIRRPMAYTIYTGVLLDCFWIIIHWILPEPNAFLQVLLYPAAYISGIFLYIEPAQRMRAILTQTILLCVPVFLCIGVGAALVSILEHTGGDVNDYVDMNGKYYILMSVLINVSACVINRGLAMLLRQVLLPANETRSLLWFLAIPLSQMVLVIRYSNAFFEGKGYAENLPSFVYAVFLSIVSDIACIFGYRKYRKLQLSSMKLREVEHQLQLQAVHYRDLQKDILTINQIRHDLKNQLQAACYLVEQGNAGEAREQLNLIDQQLSQKVGSRYCENLMVDAVLTEKASLCSEQGIQLQISALVPKQIAIENAYLCSAFSNLLDNAIAGTLKSDSPCGPIDLSSDIQGDYLKISCSNPSIQIKNQKKVNILQEHGLGLGILGNIAELGDGSFRWEWDKGIFHAVLILRK